MGTADKRTYPELWQTLVQKFGPHRAADCCPDVAPANAFIGDYLRLELLYLDGQTEKLLQEAWRRAVQAQMLAGRIDATQESLLMQGGLCILQAQSDCTELISRTLPLEAAD